MGWQPWPWLIGFLTNSSMSNILIIAAEASSVLYAEQLIRRWKEEGRQHLYWGVGSRSMEKELGFRCFGYAEEMAVMGFAEVFSQYSKIRAVFKNIVHQIESSPPDVAILIDYPGFNLKLSKELHDRKIPVVYYISPQVWAWKKNRVHTIKANVDKMLVVFPFEKDFYEKLEIPVEYVGHPLLDELQDVHLDEQQIQRRRGRLGLMPHHKVLGLMPGSRHQEIERHLDIQIKTAESLLEKHKDLRVILFVAPTLTKEDLKAKIENIQFPIIMIKDEPYNMISLADGVLAASGTATLMVGLLEKPMVIMYRMSPLTAFIGKRIVKGFFGLVNILSRKEIVPEVFQEKATPEILAPLMERALYDEAWRARVKKDLRQLKNELGEKGVIRRVAKAIESYLPRSSTRAQH